MKCPRCGKAVEGAMYCLNCGMQIRTFSEAKSLDQPSFWKKLLHVLSKHILLVIAGVFVLGFLTNILIQDKTNPPSQAVAATSKNTKKPDKVMVSSIDYNGKLDEMLAAFNNSYSSENTYTPVYAGVGYNSSSDTLIVKVNDRWNLLSLDAKKGLIATAFKSWNIMSSARKIQFAPDSFHVSIRHELSGEEVASWGPIMGADVVR